MSYETTWLPWRFPLPWFGRKRRGSPPNAGQQGAESIADARFGGEEDPEGEWVTVYWAGGFEEAYIVRGALLAEDIPVLLKGESPIYGSSALVGVRVQVPANLESRARDVLDPAAGD